MHPRSDKSASHRGSASVDAAWTSRWIRTATTAGRSRFVRRRIAVLAVLTATGVAVPRCADAPAPFAASSPAPASSVGAPRAPAGPTVSPVTAAELGASWRPGCPAEPGQLRRVEVNHIGMDLQTHRGQLIVNEDLVAEVIAVFERLYQLHYPIAKIRSVDHYPAAADELSMEDNNTSAYNCRAIPGSGRWSQHAYGRAVDLNPLFNPPSTPKVLSSRRTRPPTWTAAAPIPDSCTTGIRPCGPSPTGVGDGAATGRRPSTTSTSSGPDRRPAGQGSLRGGRSSRRQRRRSNRSRFITLTHAATKSWTNFSRASSAA